MLFSLVFACLVIFGGMLDVNFILSDTRYFYIAINILELCSGIQLSYWEAV